MRNNRIAVIGDKDSVLAFKAVGMDVYPVEDLAEAEKTVKILARDYAVIFVTEEIAEKAQDILGRYKSRPYPAIIPIPSNKGSNGVGMAGVKADVEKAIGADILFNS